MSGGKTVGERLASVETWRDDHEKRCDDRQKAMGREIGEMKDTVSGLTKGAWGIVIAFAAWAALQIYGTLKSDGVARAAVPPAHVEMR